MIAIEIKINPQMVTLARESKGLTQKELADLLGISPGKLCRVEQNDQSFSEDIIDKLTKVLKYPRSFFYQEGEAFLPTSINFRKRVKVAQKLLSPIEANINLYRLNIETLVEKMKLPLANVPVLDIKEYGSPQEAAKQLRKTWKIPKGPVENLLQIVEQHGIFVISFDFGTERVDSRTIMTKDKHPVIVLNKTLFGDRQRFSLAYELGHIFMHAFTMASFDTTRDIGHEANLFAAEFLMPENDIKKDFEGTIDIAKLAELKRKWKVSMQSLLYTATDLGFLSNNQKRYLLEIFHSQKIIRREPVELDIQKEKPLLMRNLITQYKSAHRLSVKDLAEMFCLELEEFIERYSD